MVFRKLFKGTAGKFLAILSVLRHAKRAFARGHPVRGVALVAIGILAWKWALVAVLAQGLVKLVRRGIDEEPAQPQSP